MADKEDIAAITKLVETVKHENALLLEQVKGQGQLRLAAAERRLNAHQEAFTLWRKLLMSTHTPEGHGVIMQCQDWWDRNCLFLSPEAREAFSKAYHAAGSHPILLQAGRYGSADSSGIMENWSRIIGAGDTIVRGAALPSLGPIEAAEAPDAFGKMPSNAPA